MLGLVRVEDAVFTCADRVAPGATFEACVSLRDVARTRVFVCDARAANARAPYDPPAVVRYSIPLLKSNLQKAVRLCRNDAALWSARQLIYQGYEGQTALLRRLPIIAVEDVRLSEAFAGMVWFMVAHAKGYAMTTLDWRIVLGYVSSLCGDTRARILNKAAAPSDISQCVGLCLRNAVHGNATRDEATTRALHVALACRTSYGGMAGDMRLLCAASMDANDDTAEDAASDQSTSGFPALSYPEPGATEYQLVEAVDFHCTNIVDIVVRYERSVSRDDLKDAMWKWRSSPNSRKTSTYGPEPKWFTSIRGRIDRVSRSLWKQLPTVLNRHTFPSPTPRGVVAPVYIGRGGPWGNHVPISHHDSRDSVVDRYEKYLANRPDLVERARRELRGRHLLCYCAPRRCHGDVLMRAANSTGAFEIQQPRKTTQKRKRDNTPSITQFLKKKK